MDQEKFIVYEGVEVAESPLLKVERVNRYGSVPGLDDEELADPAELERQVRWEQWGPILLMPPPKNEVRIRPELDEDGYLVGAFASADFERIKPAFDKARYKADKLREELKDEIIKFEMIWERVPRKSAVVILKNVRKGVLDSDEILDFDMWMLARSYLRARRIRREIASLDEYRERQRQKRAEEFFASLG